MMTLTVKDIKKSFNEKEVLKGAGYTFEKRSGKDDIV